MTDDLQDLSSFTVVNAMIRLRIHSGAEGLRVPRKLLALRQNGRIIRSRGRNTYVSSQAVCTDLLLGIYSINVMVFVFVIGHQADPSV